MKKLKKRFKSRKAIVLFLSNTPFKPKVVKSKKNYTRKIKNAKCNPSAD